MPIINSKKEYLDEGIYHIYNRGVNSNQIIYQNIEYYVFVEILRRSLIKDYVSSYLNPKRNVKRYYDRISLLCFCILDNHYHLLIQQNDISAMSEFIQSLQVSFTAYINKRNQRHGHLFESVYKARIINDEEDLATISRYIHLNPSKDDAKSCVLYPYSSISNYTRGINSWEFVNDKPIFSLFNNSSLEYKKFLLGTG